MDQTNYSVGGVRQRIHQRKSFQKQIIQLGNKLVFLFNTIVSLVSTNFLEILLMCTFDYTITYIGTLVFRYTTILQYFGCIFDFEYSVHDAIKLKLSLVLIGKPKRRIILLNVRLKAKIIGEKASPAYNSVKNCPLILLMFPL